MSNGYQRYDTTVNRGFPVTYWYSMVGAEPDVGIMAPYIDDAYFTLRDGRPCKWLKVSDKEIERIETEILEGAQRGE